MRKPCGAAGGVVSGVNGLDVPADAGTTAFTSFEKPLVVALLYAFAAK
jgi:hypothetical protein